MTDNTPPEGIDEDLTLDIVVEHYENSEQGRSRNARIALVLALALLLSIIFNIVTTSGWFSTTRTLDARNKAVRQLTIDGNRRERLSDCRGDAFATVADDAFGSGDYIEGRLLALYSTCDELYGG